VWGKGEGQRKSTFYKLSKKPPGTMGWNLQHLNGRIKRLKRFPMENIKFFLYKLVCKSNAIPTKIFMKIYLEFDKIILNNCEEQFKKS
jgi:hypothetical protein